MRGSWRPQWLLLLLLLLLLLGMADGLMYYYRTTHCVFNSSDLADSRYIRSFNYNRLQFLQFDSRTGLFQGYTEAGVALAKKLNNNTALLNRARHENERYCGCNIPVWYSSILSKSAQPYAVIHTSPSGGSERVLVCSVYGFYPKDITVTWTNNHQQITSGVYNTETMSDSNWYYQRHSHLEYSPRSGDQISCVVDHVSLDAPMVLAYVPVEGALSDGDRNKVAIGASGLVLGLVLSLAGFFYYRHKSRGLTLVPSH